MRYKSPALALSNSPNSSKDFSLFLLRLNSARGTQRRSLPPETTRS
ncbi:MAG TPA: hypothetical protein PLY09_06215 [Methanothrix sp.]|nr:hypothetical protein [Methanothrix sp.]